MRCVFCGDVETAHGKTFLCTICYNKKPERDVRVMNCKLNCKTCKDCVNSTITAQFERMRVGNFFCVCGEVLDDDFAFDQLE